MASKRHSAEEIVSKLRRVEVLVGQGMSRLDAIREVRITEQTFYRWRKQYGGMAVWRYGGMAVWRYGNRPVEGTQAAQTRE